MAEWGNHYWKQPPNKRSYYHKKQLSRDTFKKVVLPEDLFWNDLAQVRFHEVVSVGYVTLMIMGSQATHVTIATMFLWDADCIVNHVYINDHLLRSIDWVSDDTREYSIIKNVISCESNKQLCWLDKYHKINIK